MTGETGPSLVEALERILPPGAAFSVWEPDMGVALEGEEVEGVRRAVTSRREEFGRGRACARRALAQLGLPEAVIPVGGSRAPVWPDGFVGAITHCEGLTLSAVAPISAVGGLGIDAEPGRPLPAETRELILRPAEMSPDEPLLETIVFSAKESIHKVVHPMTGRWLDFQDVEVEVAKENGVLSIRRVGPAAREVPALLARFAVVDGYIVTACWSKPEL